MTLFALAARTVSPVKVKKKKKTKETFVRPCPPGRKWQQQQQQQPSRTISKTCPTPFYSVIQQPREIKYIKESRKVEKKRERGY